MNKTEAKLELLMAGPETIYNWRRLDDRIKTSGQPTEPQLADIRGLGSGRTASMPILPQGRVLELMKLTDW